jgi:uncharacterized protein
MTIATQKTALEVVPDMYAAAFQANVHGMLDFVGEDFVLHEPAYLPWGGVYHGSAGFRDDVEAGNKLVDLPLVSVA